MEKKAFDFRAAYDRLEAIGKRREELAEGLEKDKERESYFQLTFYLILRLLSNFLVSVEQVTSQGRIDCVVTTETDVYIFEFKFDGTVEEALAQIEAKGYGLQYATSGLTVHKIGVNFSSESGTVESWSEGR